LAGICLLIRSSLKSSAITTPPLTLDSKNAT
jgi:hypothetical protein